MRYVFLLLILCISFGVLDSVSRYKSPVAPKGIAAPSLTAISTADPAPIEARADRFSGMAQFTAYIARTMSIHHRPSGSGILVAKKGHKTLQIVRSNTEMAPKAGESVVSPALKEVSVQPEFPSTIGVSVANSELPSKTDNVASTLGIEDNKPGDVSSDMAGSGKDVRSMALPPTSFTTEFSTGSLDMARSPLPEVSEFKPVLGTEAKAQNAISLTANPIHNSLMDAHGVQFGGTAGLNWAGASATGSTGKVSGKPLTGFHIGVFADVPLKKNLSFRPRVTYSYEGYQPSIGGNPVNIHVAALKTTLDAVYHTHWVDNRFFIGGGPYVAANIGGTYALKGINTDMTFGNNSAGGDNLRRMDYGASITAGLLMDKNFVLSTSFDLGLRNMGPAGSATQIHTRSAGVSVLYVFRNRPIF